MEQGNESGDTPSQEKKISLDRTCPACEELVPADRTRCTECGTSFRVAKWKQDTEREDGFAPERTALSWGVPGGILLIVIAAIWFFVGWQAGYIFYYPPILALVGVYGIVKGIADGASIQREMTRSQRRKR